MKATALQLAEAAAYLAQEAILLSQDGTLPEDLKVKCMEMAFVDATDRGAHVAASVVLLRECGSDGTEVAEILRRSDSA